MHLTRSTSKLRFIWPNQIQSSLSICLHIYLWICVCLSKWYLCTKLPIHLYRLICLLVSFYRPYLTISLFYPSVFVCLSASPSYLPTCLCIYVYFFYFLSVSDYLSNLPRHYNVVIYLPVYLHKHFSTLFYPAMWILGPTGMWLSSHEATQQSAESCICLSIDLYLFILTVYLCVLLQISHLSTHLSIWSIYHFIYLCYIYLIF